MKHKATNDFSEIEKEMMDTIAVNYILAQSDGFQLGYAQALSDFTNTIIDYWKNSDDAPQQSILDALVDLGIELGNRKRVVKENIKQAKERGFEQYYNWQYREKDEHSGRVVKLYTRAEPYKAKKEDEKRMDDCPVEECCAKPAAEDTVDKEEKDHKSITDLLDDAEAKMCNEYCRYPFMPIPEGKDDDWLAIDPDSPCKNCPLDML